MAWNKNQQIMGTAFEDLVIVQNDLYRSRKLAVVHKVPTEWIPLRDRTGKITGAKVEKKAAVDFMGNIKGVGAIAFDAKHTDTIAIARARVEQHQADFLDDYQATEGQAYVLASFKMLDFFMVPWEVWKSQRSKISKEDIAQYRAGKRGGLPDYLEVVKRIAGGER